MPLARIITDFPDEALELAMQLRSRGFRVETISQTGLPAEPADLEVRLQECAIENVLAQASQMAEGEDLCVFIAPGALDEQARSREAMPGQFDVTDAEPEEKPTIENKKSLVAPRQAGAADPATMPEAEDPALAIISALRVKRTVPENGGGFFRKAGRLSEGVAGPPSFRSKTAGLFENSESFPSQPLAVLQDVTAKPKDPERLSMPVVPPTSESAAVPSVPLTTDPNPVGETLRRAEEEHPLAGMAPAGRPFVVSRGSRREADRAFWRIAVAAGALATLVVLAGALWHRSRPMPENLKSGAGQKIPFQKVTQTASAPASPRPMAATPSPVVVPAKPADAPITVLKATPNASADASHQVASKPPASPALSIAVTPSASVQHLPVKKTAKPAGVVHTSEGLIAKDTVVFYSKKAGAPPAKNQ